MKRISFWMSVTVTIGIIILLFLDWVHYRFNPCPICLPMIECLPCDPPPATSRLLQWYEGVPFTILAIGAVCLQVLALIKFLRDDDGAKFGYLGYLASFVFALPFLFIGIISEDVGLNIFFFFYLTISISGLISTKMERNYQQL